MHFRKHFGPLIMGTKIHEIDYVLYMNNFSHIFIPRSDSDCYKEYHWTLKKKSIRIMKSPTKLIPTLPVLMMWGIFTILRWSNFGTGTNVTWTDLFIKSRTCFMLCFNRRLSLPKGFFLLVWHLNRIGLYLCLLAGSNAFLRTYAMDFKH